MQALKTSWFHTAFWIVFAVTGLRLIALRYSNIDLFVDESQYWLWGQNLDFGYYSKPPFVAWTIRAVTELADSSSAFWVRMPAPLLHGVTALILAAWARQEFGAHSAVWVAAAYITLPIVAVGSAVISTDSIMAPFFALALLYYGKLIGSDRVRHAILTGAMIGLAMMSKYAGVYFAFGTILAAIFLPSHRISIWNAVAITLTAIVVLLPNIAWNISHDLTTLDHTLDNVDWVRGEAGGFSLKFANLTEFLISQFLVMGPVFFATLLLLIWKAPPSARGYLYLSLPIIVLVCIQALFSRAYANWAFAAYFAAILAVVPWLLNYSKKWLWAGLAVNVAVSAAIPLAAVFADRISIDGDKPLLVRHLGRDEFSIRILNLSRDNGSVAVVAKNRDVLADLFITGRDQNIRIFSTQPRGRAKNYYQQNHPFVPDGVSNILFITGRKNMACDGSEMAALDTFDMAGTAYEKSTFKAYLVPPVCQNSLK